MKKGYWNQKAATWVSYAVLAGGMATALMLFFLVRIEDRLSGLEARFDTYIVHEE